MAGKLYFNAMDASQEWYETILTQHLTEAQQQLKRILEDTETNDKGCMVSSTKQPRKVRVFGGQDRAYRFVFSIVNRLALTRDQVVRHRCHNRCCVNPEHLEVGSRADNIQDERDRRAYGVAYELL